MAAHSSRGLESAIALVTGTAMEKEGGKGKWERCGVENENHWPLNEFIHSPVRKRGGQKKEQGGRSGESR